MSRLTRDGATQPVSRDQISGANADKEIFIFPVQLTTSWIIGNLTRLIHTLAIYLVFFPDYVKKSFFEIKSWRVQNSQEMGQLCKGLISTAIPHSSTKTNYLQVSTRS